MEESYLTVMDPVNVELIEKRSKFLGHMVHVKDRQEAERFILEIRSQYKDATHNVPAYSIHKNGVMYCSDDGEPHGTSGKPILEILKREQIYDVCVVVTRYFGGVLLGTGGLVGAYSSVCKKLIENADIAKCVLCARLKIFVAYGEFAKLQHIIENCDVNVVEKNFLDKVELELLIDVENKQGFEKLLAEKTGGGVTIENIGEAWERIKIQ